MKEIIILIGCSGSGKSTYVNEFLENNHNYLRISRDSIRKTLVGNLDEYYYRKDLQSIERCVNDIEDNIFETLIFRERSIVIDNTNLKPEYINRWIKLIGHYPYNIKFKLFDIELEEAKDRVIIRDFPVDIDLNDPCLNYIDKQYRDYQNIKTWIETNHKNQII